MLRLDIELNKPFFPAVKRSTAILVYKEEYSFYFLLPKKSPFPGKKNVDFCKSGLAVKNRSFSRGKNLYLVQQGGRKAAEMHLVKNKVYSNAK